MHPGDGKPVGLSCGAEYLASDSRLGTVRAGCSRVRSSPTSCDSRNCSSPSRNGGLTAVLLAGVDIAALDDGVGPRAGMLLARRGLADAIDAAVACPGRIAWLLPIVSAV